VTTQTPGGKRLRFLVRAAALVALPWRGRSANIRRRLKLASVSSCGGGVVLGREKKTSTRTTREYELISGAGPSSSTSALTVPSYRSSIRTAVVAEKRTSVLSTFLAPDGVGPSRAGATVTKQQPLRPVVWQLRHSFMCSVVYEWPDVIRRAVARGDRAMANNAKAPHAELLEQRRHSHGDLEHAGARPCRVVAWPVRRRTSTERLFLPGAEHRIVPRPDRPLLPQGVEETIAELTGRARVSASVVMSPALEDDHHFLFARATASGAYHVRSPHHCREGSPAVTRRSRRSQTALLSAFRASRDPDESTLAASAPSQMSARGQPPWRVDKSAPAPSSSNRQPARDRARAARSTANRRRVTQLPAEPPVDTPLPICNFTRW
jgi:hypothetical protein